MQWKPERSFNLLCVNNNHEIVLIQLPLFPSLRRIRCISWLYCRASSCLKRATAVPGNLCARHHKEPNARWYCHGLPACCNCPVCQSLGTSQLKLKSRADVWWKSTWICRLETNLQLTTKSRKRSTHTAVCETKGTIHCSPKHKSLVDCVGVRILPIFV